MNIFFVLIFCLIFSVYGLINYYIGLRIWQSLGSFIPLLHPAVYWVVFLLVALSYIFGRIAAAYIPKSVANGLSIIGSYWMGAMVYFLLIFALIDIFRFLGRVTKLLPSRIDTGIWHSQTFGIIVLLVVLSVVAYGIYNARNPQITHYDVKIPKAAGELDKLHIVMISDVHLGNIVGRDRAARMVEMVNGQNPDIIIFAGDVIDENVEPFIQQNMGEEFKKLKAKYGVFAALGNHEYYGGQTDAIVSQYEKANMHVLRDSSIKIADSFYIIGREDREAKRVLGKPRKDLKEIMNGVDSLLPLIEIDHTPLNLQEAEKAGIDLQLSGHTHRGQLFPNQFITERMYEKDWGYLQKGSFQLIVSSGFGTWGAPMRTGNSPEIVDIVVDFSAP